MDKKEQILVVDGEEVIQNLLIDFLTKEGYSVYSAGGWDVAVLGILRKLAGTA